MNSIVATAAMARPAADPPASSLGLRLTSALILLPVGLLVVYAGGLSFAALVGLAGMLMVMEWDRLSGGTGAGPLGLGGMATLLAMAAAGHFLGPSWGFVAILIGAAALWPLARAEGRSAGWALLGLIWLGLPCLVLLWLRSGENGLIVVLWLLATVFMCDTGAYFAGRAIGGPKLAPRFSPKKTWAGLIGGMVSAALVGVAVAVGVGDGSIVPPMLIGAALAVISQIGDLAESAVKRRFGAKDSGDLIPGHGGVMDRFDAVLFAVPAVGLLMILNDGGAMSWL
ncbi:MAG: phosphatidate cytidylyltransferase [Alphaproteobacteria bacterium]|jgi:phosphatidate cytidylyltransferase|nr:phosphatidate cytidylyltransferase [Alphaproteobacteria bacterium]MDP6563860.1 phosphatidate cytidylyltransferase [Alphaproteobacteria bacterium]MDP6814240.1 phosphatidate cytidylyltransferase [Alphaproteobacteria bacterium]